MRSTTETTSGAQGDVIAIRVLIADDNADVRGALAALIRDEPGIELVAAAANAAEAVDLAEREQPDVALIDMRMPGGGASAASGIGARAPSTRVIALTAFATPPDGLDTDVVGCILKGSPIDYIVDSIKQAAAGSALPSWESAWEAAGLD
jgi:two-component system response regulator DesR